MLTKTGADAIQGDRIDARIDVGQDEADDLECVPEGVVIVVRHGIEVEPEEVDVHRKEADGEQDDERLERSRQEE